MKQILINQGEITIDEVPTPTVTDNSILVKVGYSLISTGTETAEVISSGESILQKVLKQPEKLTKVLDTVKTQGLLQTADIVKSKLGSPRPIGYSCAGMVVEVGKSIEDIKPHDKVACAGAGYANHAEFVCVPRNLVVKAPDNLSLKEAASVTLGAVAIQGARRANPTFGETVAVIGLGLIGQILVQILKVAGCRVIGVDLIKSRVELAQSLGIDYGIVAGEGNPVELVLKYTGLGADATIITAATQSDLPVQQAMEITRKRGKVVVVGDVGLHLKRLPFYEKEIDFLISCSYGPGRYDEAYEERGIDYPYAYVRWTENRNMQEYLRMLTEGKINFKALISKEYDIADAPEAYRELKESEDRPLGVLLRYKSMERMEGKDGREGKEEDSAGPGVLSVERKLLVNPKPIKKERTINVAVIGAGSFAQGVHLPNLRKLSDYYNIYTIVTKTGNNAKQVAKRFGANYCTTDYQEILNDDKVDMVLITTRHNLHAKMAIEAAKAGKAVFLEKPMALNREELDELVKVLEETQVPFMVGFNRRFSPFAVRAKEIISQRRNPIIINYRVNAGYIPLDNWVHTKEGGGRIIGEACHMFDFFNYFTDANVENVHVSAINPKTADISSRDNFIATLRYHDGSICNLTYTALGANEFGKEYIEIYADLSMCNAQAGRVVLAINDFKILNVFGSKANGIKSKTSKKGHMEEMVEFSKCIKGESGMLIPIEQMVSATNISFMVDEIAKKSI
jgi:predicted dehydrogenase/NADPH-dependent curcumin reductase CurA